MADKIIKIGNSTIQHGITSNRIYLMKLDESDLPDIIDRMAKLASRKKYTKIFAKVPLEFLNDFISNGYLEEARVPGFFNGNKDVVFLGKYFARQRQDEIYDEKIREVLSIAGDKNKNSNHNAPEQYKIKECETSDVSDMSLLYNSVFATYPFPIHNPKYLEKTMKRNVRYFCIRRNDEIVALASSEMDKEYENVEMTDFATSSNHSGNSLSFILLNHMESEMKKIGMKTAYTIARALSYGMNITFARMGYTYAGTLTNNTSISGHIESMNVWYKSLT